jgi:hypothetical protein
MPPKHPTAKTGFPVKPEDCYETRHLTGPEYKVYDVMMGFARYGRTRREGKDGTGPLLFNASLKPTLCNALAMSTNQTVLMKNRLLELGWIVLVQKGARKPNGQQSPDTYRILEHEEFAAVHPGQCPPYEYAPDFDTAQAYGVRHGQRLRDPGPVPDNLFPKPTEEQQITADAIAAFLDSRTREQQAELVAHWKTRSPITDVMDFALPIPKSRVRHQTLNPGDGPDPKLSEGQTLNPGSAGTYFQDGPDPKSSEAQTLNLGEYPITSPVTPSGNTNTHTQPTPQGEGVCVQDENLSAMDVEKEVAALQREFANQNDGPGGCTPKQKQEMAELVKQHGRENFRSAARAWFKNPTWDNNTKMPFMAFISGFAGYMGEHERALRKLKDKLTPEQMKVAGELAAQRRAELFTDGPDRPDGPGAEDFFMAEELTKAVKETEQANLDRATAAFQPIADANLKDVMDRKAQTEADAAQLKKDIEEGNF